MAVDARYRFNQSYNAQSMPVQPPDPSTQRFCLRWNNYHSNLLCVFDQLLHNESFVDVTLTAEGRMLRAHKMVLSACSPFFQSIFANHPDKHPIVILNDISFNDMRCLLDFMYRGEVSVDQDRLDRFLRCAESLRIKGLSEINEDKADLPSVTSSLLNNNNSNSNNNNNVQNAMQGTHHNLPQTGPKRPMPQMSQMFSPLLGALSQPKRKRGRPRKLSGGSSGAPSLDADGSPVITGSPELLEVKMPMDDFQNSVKNELDQDGEDSIDMADRADLQDQKDEQPVAGTSREQDRYPNNDYHSENHHIYLEKNQNHFNTQPSVTFELITTSNPPVKAFHENNTESVIISTESLRTVPVIQNSSCDSITVENQANHVVEQNYEKQNSMESTAGVHFLTDDENNMLAMPAKVVEVENFEAESVKTKSELLEYLIRDDGSVICKLCGEILASRTHWYRHKYKFHVNNPVTPAPLFKCTKCNVFFKSKKGYIGHVSSRHVDGDSQEDAQSGISVKEEVVETENVPKVKRKVDSSNIKSADWEQQREKEEKLVADIIDRVRRECEAQGASHTRRGYSRRTTVMNS